ncbi:MAG: hypothetical protein LBE60_10465 [Microbacterium sp.]|uniref:hypothetical protein n=1 Tax=Microbacterium sp. TaxID=51671 RepID=UPI002817243F|nr:hypothetical protein [Microbacterium sp.]MDR2322055.1 hypothetical protein [Microbacterium sp.]
MFASRKPAVVRGFAAATLSIFIALAGHVTGGGEMPGPLGLLVPWLLSLMVCVLLAGRKLSLIRLGLSVAASQLLFHTLFVLGTITPSKAPRPHVHGMPQMLPEASGILPEAVAADGTMWAGHAVAAAMTVAALHWGERLVLAIRELAAQAVRWLRRRAVVVVVTPPQETKPALWGAFHVVRPADAPHLTTLRGRAPPALSAI